MRLKINFSKNTEKVPHNLNVVNSYIHTCLGRNNIYHNSHSNYSISGLLGGLIVDGGRNIEYDNGSYIIVTSSDSNFLNKIILGILSNSELGYGMKFIRFDHISEEFRDGWNNFKTTNNGFILKRKEGGYYTLNDSDTISALKAQIINKFSKINSNLNFNDLDIVITDNNSHKVKATYSKNVKNMSNVCQINIFTNKLVAETIYNYGIGQSCGSGFGTVYTTQFNDFYK